VHRVHGDDHIGEIEGGQECSHGGDLVALRRGRQLAEHGAGGVVERGDQVRRRGGGGAGTTHGLAVDGDHPATGHDPGPGPGPHERTDRGVEDVGVEAGEHAPERRSVRGGDPGQPEPGHLLRAEVPGPLPDRGVRAGTGNHRAHPQREDHRQLMPNTPPAPRIGNTGQHLDQTGDTVRRGGLGRRTRLRRR
jgi:hypothetical protein